MPTEVKLFKGNNISRLGNSNSTATQDYIKTGSAELDRLLGGKGVETGALQSYMAVPAAEKHKSVFLFVSWFSSFIQITRLYI
jgi:hypothetical protein